MDEFDQAFAAEEPEPGRPRGRRRGGLFIAVQYPRDMPEAAWQALAAYWSDLAYELPIIFEMNDSWSVVGKYDDPDPLADLAEALGRRPTLAEADMWIRELEASIIEYHEPLILAALAEG